MKTICTYKVGTDVKDIRPRKNYDDLFYTLFFILLLLAIGLNFYTHIEERMPITYAEQMREGVR